MKKIVVFIAIIIILIVYLCLRITKCSNFKTKFYSVNNNKYCLLTSVTEQEWERGLMFYKSKKELNGADGMIFIFPDKQIRNFWNKNTFIDMDIYWMNDDTVVGKSFLPSIVKSKETVIVGSNENVNKVVEIIK